MAAAALPALVLMLMARYADGEGPEIPDGRQGQLGLTDLQVWESIWDPQGDPMNGMRFSQACVQDPRRIDALIQQRILVRFFAILAQSRGNNPREIMRDSYLLRNSGIRANYGGITAMGLAQDLRVSWEGDGEDPGYRDLFTRALWPMADAGRPEVVAIQDAIVANAQDIFRAFKEAAALAMRAAMCSEADEDMEAWEIMHGVITAMWETLSRRLGELGAQRPNEDWTLPEEELQTALPNVQFAGNAAQYMPSGHRAPVQGLPQWRRAGGRVL